MFGYTLIKLKELNELKLKLFGMQRDLQLVHRVLHFEGREKLHARLASKSKHISFQSKKITELERKLAVYKEATEDYKEVNAILKDIIESYERTCK